MNEEIISKIIHEILSRNPRFGTCSAEFQFHDNRIVRYSIKTDECHHLGVTVSKKEKENGSK